MAWVVPRSMIGAALVAALYAMLPATGTLAAHAGPALLYLTVALVAAVVIAGTRPRRLAVPEPVRSARRRDRDRLRLVRQSNPSAAGHVRPRAPGCR